MPSCSCNDKASMTTKMSLFSRSPISKTLGEGFQQFIHDHVGCSSCYGSYKDLCGVLHKYCRSSDRILAGGCTCRSACGGDSSLLEDLYDAGFHSVTGLDNLEVNISSSRERNKERRPEMHHVVGHLNDLKANFDSESFSVVVDRGELDVIHKDLPSGQRTESNTTEYFDGIRRLLKVGGRYLCFTFATADVLDRLLTYFSSGWFFRVHLLEIHVQTVDEKTVPSPLFCFVLTKTKFTGSSAQSLKIIEICLHGTDNIQRVNDFSDVKITVQEIQQFFITKKSLEKCCPGQHLSVDLYLTSGSSKQRSDPRYSLTAVDIQHSSGKNGKFAIFIVPQGRETEWLFSSREGQAELATNAGFERVVIATLGRGHTFVDMDSIKQELSTKVMELAPRKLNPKTQVPFLSVGEDLGNRVILHEGNSVLSGDYVVEDVDGDGGQKFRRLIFLSNKNVVQSEARLVTDKTSFKKKKAKQKKQPVTSSNPRVDHGYLACQHHRVIITGLAWIEGFANKGDTKRGLIVGLGGGGLAMFLYQYFKQLSLEVIELDPCISEIAKNWFEFKEDERMKVVIEDGLKCIQSKEIHPSYDVIIFDVDSKDTSVGMSCPPQAFVDGTFLTRVQSLLTPSGVFILNLVCRNTSLRDKVLSDLHTVFPELYSIRIEGEVNEIVIALPQPRYQTEGEDKKSQETLKALFRNSVAELQKQAKGQGHSWDPSLDLCELVQSVQIV